MKRTLLLAAGIALAASSGCAAPGVRVRPAAPETGAGSPGVIAVLRDLSPPSARVRFETSRAAAIREDGTLAELRVVAPPPGDEGFAEEGVWFEGSLPPGPYVGVEISFRAAATSGPGRPVPLEVPSDPVRVDAPFAVGSDACTVVAFSLRSALDPGDPGRFAPVFEGFPRARPTTGLLGVASVEGWNGVALFDKRTGALSAVLPVGRRPSGLAIDPERLRAYVAVSGDDAVAVLDLLEGRVRERVALRAGDVPRDVALTPDGRTIVVANAGSDTVSFVDPLAAIEIERVPVQGRPASLLMDRSGRRVFVLAERSSVVTVLSVALRTPLGSIAVETGPVRARFLGRDGERILVAHAESPYLTVVDSASLAIERRAYVGPGATALEVDSRSGRVFLARSRTGRIEVFDPTSFLPVEEIRVGAEIAWLAVESEGNGLGVLLTVPAEARIVGVVGGKTVARTPLGTGPAALRFVQGGVEP
jgi:YVTN family beta-propeller protein